MAEANVGTISAILRLDTAAWSQGLQQAQQQLQAFAQQIGRMTEQMRQFGQAFQQATGQQAQGLTRVGESARTTGQTFQQFNQQLNATQQNFTQNIQVLQQFNTQLTQVNTTINEARRASEGAGTGMLSFGRGLLQIAGGIGLATSLQSIVSSIRDFAAASLQAGMRLEALRMQFTALQGANQGTVTLANLFATAQRLGVEFVSLATAFRSFDAATQGTALQGEQARKVFEQITTGARAMGASTEQTGRALLALQQIVSKGRVSQEELRQQLGEALPGAMGIAARAFGVTTEEMNKMVEKGMDAITFVQAFGNQVEREFAGKAATATNTLAASWQRFSNELTQFQGALAGGELANSLRDLTDWATKFLETLRKGREFREQEMGGPAPAVPREIAEIAPDVVARQRRILQLRQEEQGYGLAAFLSPERHAQAVARMRAERDELEKLQRESIKRIQEQLAAEAQNEPLPSAITPGARTVEAIRKRYEEGIKELQRLDVTGVFVTPLELAEEKAKAWRKVLDDILELAGRIGEGLRSTLIPTGKTTPFDDLITRLAGERGLDPNLMRALIEQESGFNPRARSRAGAMGLMQLMPGTAAQYGAAGREFDPEANLRAGMNYFADLLKQFNGNVEKALTAYNAGPRRQGIPLPTGENATFARDVLRRMPGGAGDYLAQAQQMQEALRLGVEAQQPDVERRRQTFETGKAYLQALEEAEREADIAARERRQQAFATGQEYLRALEQEMQKQDQQLATLKRLAESYGMTKDARDEDIASLNAAALATTVHAEQAQAYLQTIEDGLRILKQVPQLEADAARSREQYQTGRSMVQRAEDRLEQLQEGLQGGGPFGESRETLRLSQQLRRADIFPEDRERLTALRQQLIEWERINYAVGLYEQFAGSVGQAWTQALGSIAQGTQTVGAAFKAMAQSILQSLADIAAQEGFRALIRLGGQLLTGALAGGGQVGFGAGSGFDPSLRANVPLASVRAQHGAVVNRPTALLAGENPAHNPEYILNRQQMQSLMQASPSAGGQAIGGISIINVSSREEAERQAAHERALGKQVIMNEVLSDLRQGSGSQIGRLIRLNQT